MTPEERTQAEEAIHRLVECEGYEALRLAISNSRTVVLTLDADPGPITIDDCTHMNRAVRRTLEAEGLPADDYAIEVESPGVRRALHTLRHWERFVGERVRVGLREPTADGTSMLVGTIKEVADGRVKVAPDVGGRPWTLELDEISEARLDPRY